MCFANSTLERNLSVDSLAAIAFPRPQLFGHCEMTMDSPEQVSVLRMVRRKGPQQTLQ